MDRSYLILIVAILFFSCNKESNPRTYILKKVKIEQNNIQSSDLSITKFPGDAGGIELNVNRWRGQLNLEPESLESIQSNSIKGVSELGDFKIYKLINKDLDKGFLCMILTLPTETIFAKLSTNSININYLETDFINFCTTFRLTTEDDKITNKFAWDVPDNWVEKKVDSSSLRLASYQILLENEK